MSNFGLFEGIPRDALAPWSIAEPTAPNTNQFYRQNMPRFGLHDSASDANSPALTLGVMTAVRIKLAAMDTVTNVSFFTGNTAANVPTHWWVALYSNAATPALLAQSADQVAAAAAAFTKQTIALATPQLLTKTDFYWVAVMFAGTGAPSLLGSIAVPPILTGEQNMAVTSGAALAAAATATLAAPTVNRFVPYIVVN